VDGDAPPLKSPETIEGDRGTDTEKQRVGLGVAGRTCCCGVPINVPPESRLQPRNNRKQIAGVPNSKYAYKDQRYVPAGHVLEICELVISIVMTSRRYVTMQPLVIHIWTFKLNIPFSTRSSRLLGSSLCSAGAVDDFVGLLILSSSSS